MYRYLKHNLYNWQPGQHSRYWDWTVRTSNPGRSKRFFPSTERPDRVRGSPRLLFNGYRGSFSGIKRPVSEVDHLPTFSVEVKNGWSYTSTPPICIHGVDRDNFTFCTFLFIVYNPLCAQFIQVH